MYGGFLKPSNDQNNYEKQEEKSSLFLFWRCYSEYLNIFFSEYNILMNKYVKKREKLKSLEIENSEKTKLIINMEKDYDYLIKIYQNNRKNEE